MASSYKFANINVGSVLFTDTATTCDVGATFTLGQDATESLHAVTKSQLDTAVEDIVAVTYKVDAILSNANLSLDTFKEVDEMIQEGKEVVSTLSNNVFFINNVIYSQLVYADASPPLVMNSATQLQVALTDGWYFKNLQKGLKINWYTQAPTNQQNVATVESLTELAINLQLISVTSRPFFTIYTKLKNDGTDAKTWYNAKKTLVAPPNSTVTPGLYNFRYKMDGTPPSLTFPYYKNIDLDVLQDASAGVMVNTDEILFMSIGTDSGSSAGNVECIINKLYLDSTNGNVSNMYHNSSVLLNAVVSNMSVVYESFGQEAPSCSGFP